MKLDLEGEREGEQPVPVYRLCLHVFPFGRFPFCIPVSPSSPCATCVHFGCASGKVWGLFVLLLPRVSQASVLKAVSVPDSFKTLKAIPLFCASGRLCPLPPKS